MDPIKKCLDPKYLHGICHNRTAAVVFNSFRGFSSKWTDQLHRKNTINATENKWCSLTSPADMAATTALRMALNQGISSGNLVDTKIVLYSHRDSSGRVCRPKALYTSSRILKTLPYFNDRESATVYTARVGPQRHFQGFFSSGATVQWEDFSKDIIDNNESAEDYGYLSDSDLEDDEDEKIAPFKRTRKSKTHPFDPFGVPGEGRGIACEEHKEHAETGRVVKIPDMAFVT